MPGYKPFFKSVATELNSLFEELGISNLDQYNIETIENKNHLNTKANYTDFSACHFSIAFKASDKSEHLPRRTQVELVIDRGSNPQWNDKVFEALKSNRSIIESAFYGNVFWQNRNAYGPSKSLNSRKIGVVYPFHLDHGLSDDEMKALRWWVVSTTITFYLTIDRYLPGAIAQANKTP